jgi:hypothetical protein
MQPRIIQATQAQSSNWGEQRWGIYGGIYGGSNGHVYAHVWGQQWAIYKSSNGRIYKSSSRPCMRVAIEYPLHRQKEVTQPNEAGLSPTSPLSEPITAPTYGLPLHIHGRCCPYTWPLLPLHIHDRCCPHKCAYYCSHICPITTPDYCAPASPEHFAAALLRCPRPLTGYGGVSI